MKAAVDLQADHARTRRRHAAGCVDLIRDVLSDEGRVAPGGVQVEAMVPLERLLVVEEDFERFLWPGPRPIATIADFHMIIDFSIGNESGRMSLVRGRISVQR